LANTYVDTLSKEATDLDPAQIAYFRKMVEYVISNNGKISLEKAKQVRDKLPKSQAKKVGHNIVAFLFKLTTLGWLAYLKENAKYCLGPRAYIDLKDYLESKVETKCKLCNSMCVMGLACRSLSDSSDCPVKLHSYCAAPLFAKQERACPQCKRSWGDAQDFKEEELDVEPNDENKGIEDTDVVVEPGENGQLSQAESQNKDKTRARPKKRKSRAQEEIEEEPGSQPTQSRRSGRLSKRKQRSYNEDEEFQEEPEEQSVEPAVEQEQAETGDDEVVASSQPEVSQIPRSNSQTF